MVEVDGEFEAESEKAATMVTIAITATTILATVSPLGPELSGGGNGRSKSGVIDDRSGGGARGMRVPPHHWH